MIQIPLPLLGYQIAFDVGPAPAVRPIGLPDVAAAFGISIEEARNALEWGYLEDPGSSDSFALSPRGPQLAILLRITVCPRCRADVLLAHDGSPEDDVEALRAHASARCRP